MSKTLTADYLVVGTGGMGMAFTDALMTETDATVIMVDRHARPGGHWNDAYPFVRLHQPSNFYGVNSRKLGNDSIDKVGWNQGLYELASGSEVVTYFDQVMQQQFLPSGRVQYFPMSEYHGEDRFSSLLTGDEQAVAVNKTVDSTYMDVRVPSVYGPRYPVADGVQCVPPNDLPKQRSTVAGYVVVGAGKTAMDACLWLLSNGVDPDRITWIMPRDSWMFDRANIQPPGIPRDTDNTRLIERDKLPAPTTLEEMLENSYQTGGLLLFDEEVRPTMWRCATVTKMELAQLRRIKNIVRKGRVKRITQDTIELAHGTIATSRLHLHVDCSADGLANRPAVPVFQGNRLVLQSLRTCQQVFSAALIGHVEGSYSDDELKNQLCTPVPHPNTILDMLRTNITAIENELRWSEDSGLVTWLEEARLYGPKPKESPRLSSDEREQQRAGARKSVEFQRQLLVAEEAKLAKNG